MRVYHFPTAASTNDLALALSGSEPVAAWADTQTSGVGRQGRSWVSPPGGAWLSVAWQSAGEPAALPLAVGVVASEVIEAVAGVATEVKWPNDILVGGKKLAGIICLRPAEGVTIVGIGVNANFRARELATQGKLEPTTLLDETGRDTPLDALVAALARAIGALREGWKRDISLCEAVGKRLAWRGKDVEIRVPGGPVMAQGTLNGVDAEGRVQIMSSGGLSAHASGELALRAAAPPAP